LQAFDLVYVATAFHWITPEVRFAKPHSLLKPYGHLAIIYRNHVSDEKGDVFDAAVQPIYRRYKGHSIAGARTYVPRALSELRPEPIDEKLFRPVSFSLFPEVVRYSAEDYVHLLTTYSPTLAMPADARRALLGDIEHLINEQFGGYIVQHYAMGLQITQSKVLNDGR
jgi:SAM-dependent methyltransferase